MLKVTLMLLAGFLLSQKIYAGEKSLYDFLWLDPDKKVYVLQNKIYKKENTFYADIGYLSNFTSTFQKTDGFVFRGGYYFKEEWGVEVFYNHYNNSNNENWNNIRNINGADPFVRRFNSSVGAMAIWSPFYGKINTFNKIFYFDWSFGLGVAQVSSESNRETVTDTNLQSAYAKEKFTALAWKTNIKFHVNENIHIGAEWMQHHYSGKGPSRNGREPKDKFRNNQDFVLSVGFSF